MADEQNGKFTEVYELALNTEKFVKSLQATIAELKKFADSLNKAVGEAGGKVIEDLTDKSVKANAKRVKNTKETVDQLISEEKRLHDMRSRLGLPPGQSRTPGRDPKTGRFVSSPDVQSANYKVNDPARTLAQNINISQEGLINRYNDAQEKARAKEINDRAKAGLIEIDRRYKEARKTLEENLKQTLRARDIFNKRIQDAENEQLKIERDFFRQRRREKVKEDTEFVNAEKKKEDEITKNQRDALALRLRLMRQHAKELAAQQKRDLADEISKAKKAQEAYAKAQQDSRASGSFLPGGSPSYYQSPRALGPGGAPPKQPEIEAGFVDKVFKGFANSAAVALRYSIIFGVIQTAVDVFSEAVLAPFKALQNGVTYLRELESQAIELTGVLNTNVEFSKDFAENLKLSAAAAKEVQRALEDVAAETGVNLERLQAVFKFFISNGGAALVKTTKEAVDFAKLYTVVIESAGLQSLQLASETAKIGELLQDDKFNNPIFLKALSLTSTEWIKIRTEAGKTKDLYQTLEKLARPQLDAIKDSAVQQSRVVKQVELLISRIQALGALGVYQKITQFLQAVEDWLKANEVKIVNLLTVVGNAITSIANALLTIKAPEALLFVMQELASVVGHVSFLISGLVENISFAVKAAGILAEEQISPSMLGTATRFKQLAAEYTKFYSERQKQKRDLEKLDNDIFGIGNKSADSGDSLLDRDISNKNPSNRDPSQAGVAASGLNLELKGIEDKRKQMKFALDKYRNDIKEREAERLIDKQQYAEELILINNSEIANEKKLLDESIKIIRKQQQAAMQGTTNAEQIATINNNFRNKEVEAEARYYENLRQLSRDSSQATREASKAKIAITKAENEAERKELLAGITKSIEESKAAEQAGFITKVEAFDEQVELERRKLQIAVDSAKEQTEVDKALTADKVRYLGEYKAALKELEQFEASVPTRKKVIALQENAEFNRIAREQLAVKNDLQSAQNDLVSSILGRDNFTIADNLLKKRREEIDLARNQKQAELEIQLIRREAGKEDTVAIATLRRELEELNASRLDNLAQRISLTDQLPNGSAIQNSLREKILREARADASSVGRSGLVSQGGTSVQATAAQIAFAKKLTEIIDDLLRKNAPTAGNVGRSAFTSITGLPFETFRDGLSTSTSNLKKFATVADVVTGTLATVGNALSVFSQGKESGGLLGGIGGLASQFGDLAGPIFGSIVKAFGGVASLIGSIFVAATKRIVEDVNKKFEDTLQDFNRGNLGLADTIDALNKQRVDAINRLSGKKNGKDELSKLLKQFDDQIFNLQSQQKEIIENFNEEVRLLALNSDYLSNIEKQWQDINKQVKEYLAAGGDASKAAEFLSAQLGRIKEQAIDDLSSAEQSAIQDVIRLNELLEQRNQIVSDFKKKEFDLINADSIERRQTGSIARGKELAELREAAAKNIADLDSQIKLQTVRVDKEREIFNLSTNLAELRRRDEELTLLALDKQLDKLRELQSVVGSITSGPNGFTGSGIFGSTNNTNIVVNVSPNFGDSPSDIGRDIANSLSAELGRRQRLAMA